MVPAKSELSLTQILSSFIPPFNSLSQDIETTEQKARKSPTIFMAQNVGFPLQQA